MGRLRHQRRPPIRGDNNELILPSTPEDREKLAIEQLEREIDWYQHFANTHRKGYYWAKVIGLVSASAIPVLAVVSSGLKLNATIPNAILGAVVVLAAGFESTMQLHAQWINFQTTVELLQLEYNLFIGRGGPYSELAIDARVNMLASRMAALSEKEHNQWMRLVNNAAVQALAQGGDRAAGNAGKAE